MKMNTVNKQVNIAELICEIANTRNENHHLKRVLSETKLAIKDALKCHSWESCCVVLNKTVSVLEANGVKDLFTLNFDL